MTGVSAHLPLLIIGAGPYGLAMAAYAAHRRIEYLVVGKTMDFWKSNMPKGMYLRSGCDWHYDPFDEHTLDAYLERQNLKPKDVEPLELDFYLTYVDWFIEQKRLRIQSSWVERLNYVHGPTPYFRAVLQNGNEISATNVVLALGFRYFKNVPPEYAKLFPGDRLEHTCDFVDLARLKEKRVLIIGGRQSAFEWAALLNEHGAAKVNLSYRHPTPRFAHADWTWVSPLVDAMVEDPGWFRRLSTEEQVDVDRRLWAEGRLKLEPWLAERISSERIKLFPESHVTNCRQLPAGDLEVTLDAATLFVDQIILATGYKVNVRRVPLLADGNILPQLEILDGFPVLDEHFQSNLPGLFFTSMCATRAFGPFFGFTSSIRTSAKLIGEELEGRLNHLR